MALYLFVFLGLFTPGPNVVLLTASGARFGFMATVPHILGVAVGVGVTAGLTGLGLASLLLAAPQLTFVLKLIAAGWILWMAFQLLRAAAVPEADDARPFTLFQAILFQWVNPKVWAVALSAAAGYSIGLNPTGEALRLASAFSGINLFVCAFWTFAGTMLAFLLKTPAAWSMFRAVMGILLAGSAVLVFL